MAWGGRGSWDSPEVPVELQGAGGARSTEESPEKLGHREVLRSRAVAWRGCGRKV